MNCAKGTITYPQSVTKFGAQTKIAGSDDQKSLLGDPELDTSATKLPRVSGVGKSNFFLRIQS